MTICITPELGKQEASSSLCHYIITDTTTIAPGYYHQSWLIPMMYVVTPDYDESERAKDKIDSHYRQMDDTTNIQHPLASLQNDSVR